MHDAYQQAARPRHLRTWNNVSARMMSAIARDIADLDRDFDAQRSTLIATPSPVAGQPMPASWRSEPLDNRNRIGPVFPGPSKGGKGKDTGVDGGKGGKDNGGKGGKDKGVDSDNGGKGGKGGKDKGGDHSKGGKGDDFDQGAYHGKGGKGKGGEYGQDDFDQGVYHGKGGKGKGGEYGQGDDYGIAQAPAYVKGQGYMHAKGPPSWEGMPGGWVWSASMGWVWAGPPAGPPASWYP